MLLNWNDLEVAARKPIAGVLMMGFLILCMYLMDTLFCRTSRR